MASKVLGNVMPYLLLYAFLLTDIFPDHHPGESNPRTENVPCALAVVFFTALNTV